MSTAHAVAWHSWTVFIVRVVIDLSALVSIQTFGHLKVQHVHFLRLLWVLALKLWAWRQQTQQLLHGQKGRSAYSIYLLGYNIF